MNGPSRRLSVSPTASRTKGWVRVSEWKCPRSPLPVDRRSCSYTRYHRNHHDIALLSDTHSSIRRASLTTWSHVIPWAGRTHYMNALVQVHDLARFQLWKDSWFEQIDRKLRVAGRKAIHAPGGTPNEYIYRETNLPHSFKELIHTRAKNYIRNERRPPDFIEWRDKQKYRLPRGKISRTPLGVLEITELGLG